MRIADPFLFSLFRLTDDDDDGEGNMGKSFEELCRARIQSFAKKLEADLNIINEQGFKVSLDIKNYQKA